MSTKPESTMGLNKMISGYGAIARLIVLTGLMLVNSLVMAASIKDINFETLPGDKVKVIMTMSGAVDKPLSFAIEEPARIALDMPGVTVDLERKTKSIGIGMARSITAVESGDRTRVVLNLIKLVPYEINTAGNQVILTLEGGGTGIARVSAATSKKLAAATATTGSIDGIDFRRGELGEARVIISLSDEATVVDSREEGGRIVIDFLDSTLPEKLERTLDVIDFATPLKTVDTFAHGNGVRMVLKPVSDEYTFLAYQSDNLFTAEVKPITKEDAEVKKKKQKGFTGERLSLNFQSIEVRAILQLLADFTGLNLVASDSVGGNLTLRLKNVPWDQALDIILKSRGLAMRQSGNVIMVAPADEVVAREQRELEAMAQKEVLAPLRTEFIQVNFAKAKEIQELLVAEGNSLITDRGSVGTDERTNTLLVKETADNLLAIRQLVERLDVPVRQVMIESRIVIASDTFSKDIGVRFGSAKTALFGSENDAGVRENFFTAGGKLKGRTNYGARHVGYHQEDISSYVVDLAAATPSAALGMAVGKIGSYLLELELSAMQLENKGEIIANPRVITSNQQTAVIEQGREIAFQTIEDDTVKIAFKEVLLKLEVTPQITPNDNVIMELLVENDTLGDESTTFGQNIDSKKLETKVLVKNGETVVLGGVYDQIKRDTVEKVPFFGDLPVLGHLFRLTLQQNDKTELLVFVTPSILDENMQLSSN